MSEQLSHGPTPPSLAAVEATISENRTWFMALGIVLILLGFVALAFPFITTIAAKTFLGWLFMIGGIFQLVHAFSTQKWSGFFLNLLIGAIYILAGGWLAFFPLAGILTLTILLAIMFIFQGVLESSMAIRMRPLESWVWMLVAGIVAIVVGAMIILGLPSSAVWAIGLLVGINMISSGWAYFFLGFSAGKKD